MDALSWFLVVSIVISFVLVVTLIRDLVKTIRNKREIDKLKSLIVNFDEKQNNLKEIKEQIKKCSFVSEGRKEMCDLFFSFKKLKKEFDYSFGFVIGDGYGSEHSIKKTIRQIQREIHFN